MKLLLCHRCQIEMEDDGEWYTCPCCRSRTRGPERQEARFQAERERLGMTEEEYSAHCRSFIRQEPLSKMELRKLRALVSQRAEDWVPVCEHETVNPWKDRGE